MKTYTIREISQLFNIPASTLRYYEDMGLLPNVEHTPNHQRIYTEEHINRLGSIICFKNTGMTISKIHDFFTYESDISQNIDAMVDLVMTHECDLMKQIETLQKDLNHIRHKVWYYQTIRDAISKNLPWPEWDDYPQA